MPTYLWRCPSCDGAREVIAPVAMRNTQEVCRCQTLMVREITAPLVQPDITPYRAVTGDKAGQYINSRYQHKEFLKRNGLREAVDPPSDTRQFRKTVTRREIREELKRVVPEVLRRERTRRTG